MAKWWDRIMGNVTLPPDEDSNEDDMDSVLLRADFDRVFRESLAAWKPVITSFYSAATKGLYKSTGHSVAIKQERVKEWGEKWREFVAALEDYKKESFGKVIGSAEGKAASFANQELTGKIKITYEDCMWLINNLENTIKDICEEVNRNIIRMKDDPKLRAIIKRAIVKGETRYVLRESPDIKYGQQAHAKIRAIELSINKIKSCLESVYN